MEEKENIIKKVCKELNINQAELSRKLDVSPATVSDWAKGNIPKMAEMALELMLENKEIKEHLKNIKAFYETLQKI